MVSNRASFALSLSAPWWQTSFEASDLIIHIERQRLKESSLPPMMEAPLVMLLSDLSLST